ncbi:unnamed protein product [Prunus armeniaca]
MAFTTSANASPKEQYNSAQITAQPSFVRAICSDHSGFPNLVCLANYHNILQSSAAIEKV